MKFLNSYNCKARIKYLRLAAVIALLVTAMLVGLALYFGLRELPITCMGVELLTEEGLAEYTPAAEDFDVSISVNGQPAPFDATQATVYVTQTITAETLLADLEGELGVDEGYTLYFAPDPALDDLNNAVSEGHAFTLIVVNEQANYVEYKLVFTTLPVMRLDGSSMGMNDEEEEIYAGSICLWWAADPSEGGYSVKPSLGEWHERGESVKNRPKEAWKLSLKEEDGDNRNLSFLGMGSDDDWLLNPLSYDNLKVRENLTAGIWERLNEDAEYPLAMSFGQYVEVVINGKYYGLYMLQRRIDRKFLSLEGEDVLLKAQNSYTPIDVRQAYEVIYSAKGEEHVYEMVNDFFTTSDPQSICLENWIDLEILLQIGNLNDNISHKNMYYLWHEGKIYFLPWDVDLSFGLIYDDGIRYDASSAKRLCSHRREYDALRSVYSDLDARIAARWQELRREWLTEETLLEMADRCREFAVSSGAVIRDEMVWGVYSGDTTAQLTAYIRTRLNLLDYYYALFE